MKTRCAASSRSAGNPGVRESSAINGPWRDPEIYRSERTDRVKALRPDYVPNLGRANVPLRHVMSNSFAFGGTGGVLIASKL